MTKTNENSTLTLEQYESKLDELLKLQKAKMLERFIGNNVESYWIEIDHEVKAFDASIRETNQAINKMDREIFRSKREQAKIHGIDALALIGNQILLKC